MMFVKIMLAVRTECGMCGTSRTVCSVVCMFQLFCSAWMCCLEEVYKCYLDHLKFCVVCIDGRGYVCCSECNVVSNECHEPTSCLVQPID